MKRVSKVPKIKPLCKQPPTEDEITAEVYKVIRTYKNKSIKKKLCPVEGLLFIKTSLPFLSPAQIIKHINKIT